MGWFLIPGNTKNIKRSIANPVDSAELRAFLPETECTRLETVADGEGIRCWAMSDGRGGRAQFKKMLPGDYVLITQRGTGRFGYFAEVTEKIVNKALGDFLWPVKPRSGQGDSPDARSWKHIYFLKNVRAINVEKASLVTMLGFKSSYQVSASRRLDDSIIADFEGRHGLFLSWLRENAGLDWPHQAPSDNIALSAVRPDATPAAHPPPAPGLGAPYQLVTATPSEAQRQEPIYLNAEKYERGLRGHADTQNALAAFLEASGIAPRKPIAGEPDYDLSWMSGHTVFVAEVKSTTPENEEVQLRLGLGQVLFYRHQLSLGGRTVIAVLAPEREPTNPAWLDLCSALGVMVTWPGAFDRVLANT